MENKKIIVDTELDITQYVKCTQDIASNFFDDEGEYSPDTGMLYVMCVFYNICVKESPFKDTVGDEVSRILDIKDIAKDSDFIKEFNAAIRPTDTFELNFNNAYKQAMDIIESKKSPINNIINLIKNFGTGLNDSLGVLLNPDTINGILKSIEDNSNDTVES